jgi:hypothetical protein
MGGEMKRFILAIGICALICGEATAAAFTSKASGNWSASGQTTWNEVGVPGNGDTVTITHAITVDTNTTIGSSPAEGTVVVTASANITVNSGVTLTLRGDMALNNCALILGTGTGNAHLVFDASAASSPTTQNYRVVPGTAHNQASTFVDINGTSGAHCTVTSHVSGGNGYFGVDYLMGGIVQADYCDFSDLGSASQDAIQPYCSSAAGKQFWVKNCTFTDCGSINLTYTLNLAADINFEIEDCKFTGGLGSYDAYIPGSNRTSGTRSIQRNYFGKSIYLSAGGFTVKDNYFNGKFYTSGADSWAEFSGNLVVDDAADVAIILRGSVSNCYWLENHTNVNPHGLQPFGTDVNQSVTNCVFEHTGTNNPGEGDHIVCNTNPTSARTLTVTGNILLPNAAGHSSGALLSMGGGANLTAVVEHNTYYAESSGVSYGETYAGHVGMISKFRSNLAHGPGSLGYKLAQINSAGTPTDTVDPDFVNYNAGYGLAAGTEGGGYEKAAASAAMFTGTRGVDWAANDLSSNPSFADSTRDLGSWGQVNESTDGSVAAALAVLAADPSKVGGMITWVRNGFKVTNAAYATAGHDSTPPGAMEYQAAGKGMNYYQQNSAVERDRQQFYAAIRLLEPNWGLSP